VSTQRGVSITRSPQHIPQVCVVPFRWEGDQLELCLITSLRKQRWIFPKGIIEPGETPDQAALKEAREEAGLRGQVVGEPLGAYQDSKWHSDLRVTVLAMEVSGCDDEWPEADVRERCWTSPEEAKELISKPELRRFVEVAVETVANK
jgi:phosphohistidine phosphatase